MGYFDGFLLASSTPIPPEVVEMVDSYVSIIKDISTQRGHSQWYPHVARRVNAFVARDASGVYLITQPTSDARSHYYHEFGDVAIGAASVFSSAVEQIGFLPEYTTVTWLPRGPANEDARDRDKRLSAVAYHDILEQEADDARSSPQVREMRPIFGAAPATIDPKLCFVLMPFDPELREVYDDYIAPSASAANLIAARADDIFSNRPIMQDIWEHICRARIIVADLTKKESKRLLRGRHRPYSR